MAPHIQPKTTAIFACFCFLLFPLTAPTTFSFPSFSQNDRNITVIGDASISGQGSILLTDNQITSGKAQNSTGRAFYAQPIQLWDSTTNSTTDFTTQFQFSIVRVNSNNNSAGGISFFLASENSKIPTNSSGGWLGLFNETIDNISSNQLVAIEFDTFQDPWDPSSDHVGIDVNSIVSKANKTWAGPWISPMSSGEPLYARISYNGTSKDFDVYLKFLAVPVDTGSLNLTYNVDLKRILPEKVTVGFSAATGTWITAQSILSWNFTSSLDVMAPVTAKPGLSTWGVGSIVTAGVLVVGLGIVLTIWRRNSKKDVEEEDDDDDEEMAFAQYMDDDFERGTGPKRFTYKELVSATDGFLEEGKLGEGGFGAVYRGFLSDLNLAVAVKKISSGSKQGRKEYASEVKIISRLRHRNLVQLIGWSHGRGKFLLVYEFMPNRSLDSHLFGKTRSLSWGVRFKIARGLASAVLYLHEEWEQCVVHRDIKSSNVMLDSDFNAKLGDFGLARLVDHGLVAQTTVVAGTMGYLAPECLVTGKASEESDVFSFGVVALEIACGRRAIEPKAEESEVRLVDRVWEVYGRSRLLDAADRSLNMDFDEREMECLMVVGLWCAHPDRNLRPTIRQAIRVLNFEVPLPDLPAKMPVPVYLAPEPTGDSRAFSITWTSYATGR